MNRHPTARALVGATLRRRRVVVVAGWALVAALPTFVGGQAVARAVDHGFLAGRPGIGLAWLALLAGTVPVGAFGAHRMYLGVASLVEPLRDDLVHAVVHDALWRSTDGKTTSDDGAVARLTHHVEAVRETVAGLLLLVLGFLGAVVAALAGLTTLAPVVLPFVVVPLVLALGLFVAGLPGLTHRQRRLLLADERLAEEAGEAARGVRDIVACGAEPTVTAALDAGIDEHVAAGRALARVAALRTVVVSIGARLPVVLVLAAGAWLMGRGLSPGDLLGTFTYLIQGLEPAMTSMVDGVGVPLAQLSVTVRRIDAAAETRPGGEPGSAAGVIPADVGIEVRDVTFRYRPDARPVLDGLDLDIPDGDHLAVVGPSGAGKSTLAALMVGVLRPQEGRIRLGGHPPTAVAADARVLIPQHAYVFRGTLAENLRYLRPNAPHADLDRAVDELGIAGLVDHLGGYGAEIDPGRLSMGERQLVTLARAHLSSARLLVLDEATCHLDPVAEAVAERALAARPGTLVVVAHRISSALRARTILVVDGADTVRGCHDDLVRRSPRYRELVGHWLDPADR